MTPYIICTWPDGTWCVEDDLEDYLQFMSDDFIKEEVIRWDGDYFPLETRPWTHNS